MNLWIGPTEEKVAEVLADGLVSTHYGYDWEIDYERDGSAITVTVTPRDVDTHERLERYQKRFQVLVVEEPE